ncbi:tetratricopeptide repeat protein [Actinoplanes solisilvae]|uniref:tetratricopeptide repeat protein n=1 Tax=Actinoplanes solisilvae TaxID=2486853 RepID=UPI0013E3F187|nr:tetratricopeptide repeat protein [Actinoplanes solisilvae]
MQTDLLLDRAGALLAEGRAAQAAGLLTPVVDAEPGNAVAWLLLARARMALGSYGDALEAARTALGLNPRGVEELYWVSAAYTALGRHDLAVTAAAAAVEEDPGNPRPAERHGRALLAAGRTAEAETLLAAAAEIAYYDADVQVAYGMALFAAGRPLSAREAYSRAVRLVPGHERALAEVRRLTVAEERIVDAESLVRVGDEFAESLRVPAGGVRREGSSVAAHVAAVLLGVLLVALLVLAVLIRVAGLDVPMPLLVAVFCATASAACFTAWTRRRKG